MVGVSSGEFKQALSHWPSGVSLVTSQSDATLAGMTVSAFLSVSLAPPLIAVCLDQRALTLAVIVSRRRFAVNVLSAGQSALSERFAVKDNEPIRFDGVALDSVPGAQSPLISGAVVHLDCALDAMHEAGDHMLCVGRVELALTHPGLPLIYYASNYRHLALPVLSRG